MFLDSTEKTFLIKSDACIFAFGFPANMAQNKMMHSAHSKVNTAFQAKHISHLASPTCCDFYHWQVEVGMWVELLIFICTSASMHAITWRPAAYPKGSPAVLRFCLCGQQLRFSTAEMSQRGANEGKVAQVSQTLFFLPYSIILLQLVKKHYSDTLWY